MLKENNKIFLYGLTILSILFFCISLSQTLTRYNLNQQLAISDRIINNSENIYPSDKYVEDKEITVSQYFPGLAIIISPINFLISNDKLNNIFYGLFALIAHFSLIFILAKIHSSISQTKIFFSFFSVLIFSLLITKSYSFYSLELKPDTLAFSCGLWALYKSKLGINNENNFIQIFFYGIIFGLGLIFKQQYISFLGGILLYNIFFFNKKNFVFTFGALITTAIILFIFNNFNYFWFWNLQTFKDDGFMGLGEYLNVNKFIIFSFLLFFIVFINLSFQEIKKDQIYNFIKRYIALFKNPYLWILGPASISCFLSGYKIGGNISNTGLGLLLLFPLIFSIIKNIDVKWLKIFFIFGILNILSFSIKSTQNIKLFYDLKYKFDSQEFKKGEVVLYGSTFYSIVKNNDNIILNDYWTDAQRKGSQLRLSLSNNLKKKNIDYILVEFYLKDVFKKQNNNNFEILIENNIGLLAKRTNF